MLTDYIPDFVIWFCIGWTITDIGHTIYLLLKG